MRFLPGAIALLLAGWSLGDPAPPRNDNPAGAPPPFRKLITANVVAIFGDASRAQGMKISGVRRVDSLKGPAWLVCVRTMSDGRALDYAVFIQDEKIVDSRLAVRGDHCEAEALEPFGVFTDSQRAIH